MDNQDVQKAIAAVKANPSDYESPLPWRADDTFVFAADGTAVAHWVKRSRAAHIADAVNAAPVLVAGVERLTGLLATSEHLRQLEAQAVAQAIRAPDRPLRVPRDLICALRGVGLPEDFLPAAEKIFAKNARLKDMVSDARAAVEALPPYPHHEYCNGGRECDCTADGDNALRVKARRALGLEVGNG